MWRRTRQGNENTVAQAFASKLAFVAMAMTMATDSDHDDDDGGDDRQSFASKLAVVAAATTTQTFASQLALNL